MLIEQIIEFDIWGPGSLAVHVLLQMVIFMTKQKPLMKIFETGKLIELQRVRL